MARTDTTAHLKKVLRISHSQLDSLISAQVDACLDDLARVGIAQPSEDDTQILNALTYYVLAEDTDDINRRAFFRQEYDRIRAELQVSTGYGLDE